MIKAAIMDRTRQKKRVKVINSFQASAPFLYPLKTLKRLPGLPMIWRDIKMEHSAK